MQIHTGELVMQSLTFEMVISRCNVLAVPNKGAKPVLAMCTLSVQGHLS